VRPQSSFQQTRLGGAGLSSDGPGDREPEHARDMAEAVAG
jgi:hypothetical protein